MTEEEREHAQAELRRLLPKPSRAPTTWALLGRPPGETYGVGMEFYGQEGAKAQIEPFLKREEGFPNTLLLGQPGMGKTRMARWIADQRAEPFEELLCPVNPDDVPRYGVVLLDECHRQRHPEWLFPIMEKPETTILGATTRPEMLDSAFKSRFMLTLHLKAYDDAALIQMGQSILNMSDEMAEIYAAASAGNPRQLEMILAVASELGADNPVEVLTACRITTDGLTEYHLDVLKALRKAGRPTGLSTLASVMSTDEQSIKDAEKLLVELDLVELRSNGRVLTRTGKSYLTQLEQTPK